MAEAVAVRVLERDYLVACEPEQRPRLLEAAALLDGRMRELRAGVRSVPPMDRLAVLAALNLASELIEARQALAQLEQALSRIETRLAPRIERLLEEQRGR
ncbi:MAG: cell division protein ZapA [Xanthomonadales bacterium]|nr:cell division protein ZapA [Xanthomonadales bacterium]